MPSSSHHNRKPSGGGLNRGGGVIGTTDEDYEGPVDLDALFQSTKNLEDEEDGSLFSDQDDNDDDEYNKGGSKLLNPTLFSNPHRRLLDKDASQIPGSPFSKPRVRRSNRPSEPLAIAKYASTVALMLTVTWLAALLWYIFSRDSSISHLVVEFILTVRFCLFCCCIAVQLIVPELLTHLVLSVYTNCRYLPLWDYFGIHTFWSP